MLFRRDIMRHLNYCNYLPSTLPFLCFMKHCFFVAVIQTMVPVRPSAVQILDDLKPVHFSQRYDDKIIRANHQFMHSSESPANS